LVILTGKLIVNFRSRDKHKNKRH